MIDFSDIELDAKDLNDLQLCANVPDDQQVSGFVMSCLDRFDDFIDDSKFAHLSGGEEISADETFLGKLKVIKRLDVGEGHSIYSDYSGAFGVDNNVGSKGWMMTKIIGETHQFKLSGDLTQLCSFIKENPDSLYSYAIGNQSGTEIGKISNIDVENGLVTLTKWNDKLSDYYDKDEEWFIDEFYSDDNGFYFISNPDLGDVEMVNFKASFAFGYNNSSIGKYSFTNGRNCIASGRYGHAEGDGSFAGQAAHAEGFQTKATGPQAHAEGRQTTASGSFSHAEGQSSNANGEVSHAEGYKSSANGKHSHAEGNVTNAKGESSHSEGNKSAATGNYSHAEGDQANTSGTGAHAEGFKTNADGIYSHAEGSQTIASGLDSHAEGSLTNANGIDSHAQGSETYANGDQSHAGGNQAFAHGDTAFANGHFVAADGENSIALGANAMTLSGETYEKQSLSVETGKMYKFDNGWYEVTKVPEGDEVLNWGFISMSKACNRSPSLRNQDLSNKTINCSSNGTVWWLKTVEPGTVLSNAFVWSGDYYDGTEDAKTSETQNISISCYQGHGHGTFNINPIGGINGLYIGDKTLNQIISKEIIDYKPLGGQKFYLSSEVGEILRTLITTLGGELE